MPKLSEATKGKIKEAVRHPVQWWRGAELPEDEIRPWEGGIQFFAEALKGFMSGFTGIKGRLYEGMGEGKIPPNWISVSSVIGITWDGINDPMIGSYMDRKRFSVRVLRWIMRFNATLSPLFILIQCFDLGLTPLQRIIQWTLISMFSDIMSTANTVGESKIWAGITPHSKQRGVLQLCRTLGNQVSQWFSAIPTILMGLKDVLNISDYQIMIFGALIFAPLTIFCRWLPSFAKQRVDFTTVIKGEDDIHSANCSETEEPEEEKAPTLRESFSVVKHNKFFLMTTIISFLCVLIPGTDEMFVYNFLLPTWKIRGKEINGLLVWSTKNIVVGQLGTFLQPFALQFIKKFGGELNMMRLNNMVSVVGALLKYFIGYKSIPRLVLMYLIEMIQDVFRKWDPVAHNIVNYQMLDYVEWKTGQRSEGMTIAVSGFLNKLIKSNISTVFGNAVKQWTGYKGWEFPREEQPDRFIKTIWPLKHFSELITSLLWLIGYLWFRMPHDPKAVENDLVERRAQAEQAKEEAESVE